MYNTHGKKSLGTTNKLRGCECSMLSGFFFQISIIFSYHHAFTTTSFYFIFINFREVEKLTDLCDIGGNL